MKVRNVFALMLSVMLLLAAGSGLAQGPQPTESSEAVDVNADPTANAPWFNIEVDTPGNVGQYASVAINPLSDTTYVSYYDATNMNLRLAMNRGFGSGGNCGPDNSWLCYTVDSGGDVGKFSSIAINPVNGEIGIAYYDATNGKLKYAHAEICTICPWKIDTIDAPILFPTDNKGQFSSLKYHSNGKPYIAYYFENTGGVDALMVATGDVSGGNCGIGSEAGKWQCDTIQTGEGVGQYASLALDGAGQPRIAYSDGGNNALMYAYQNAGYWTIREILPTNSGQYASLDVDVNNGDLPHIAHYDATNGKLGYAVYVGSNGNCGFNNSATKFEWQCDEIATMGAQSTHPRTRDVSLAVDKAGFPIIAYSWYYGTPFSGRGFSRARPAAALGLQSGNCGLQDLWQCEGIQGGFNTGDYSAIAVHPSGLATIAYYYGNTVFDSALRVSYQRFHQIYLPLVMKNQ